MELRIKKALNCCSGGCDYDNCPYRECDNCVDIVICNAATLIKEKDENIFQLENRLKECENGYEGTLHLERCKLHDAEQKIAELTEKNEIMKGELLKIVEEDIPSRCVKEILNTHSAAISKQSYTIGVQNMAERLKAAFPSIAEAIAYLEKETLAVVGSGRPS